jgi:tetratricopeptide (TPR) repeat protein
MRYVAGTRRLWGVILAVSGLLAGTAAAQQARTDTGSQTGSGSRSDSGADRAQTKTTPAVRADVFARMTEAQTCLDEGDTDCAFELLRELEEDRDLNSYEQANLLGLYAVIYFDLEDFESAARSYEAILELPRIELPDGLIEASMKNLASTYWNLERPRDALDVLDQWFGLPTTVPASSDWYLKGSMHYQIEEYEEGAEAVRRAIRLANDRGDVGEETWYQLLAALYDELGETDLVIETLTILVEHWTKRQNVLQLAGQLQQAGRDNEMLVLFEAAYAMGWLRTSSELVALASLLLQADTPFKAATVLEQGLADGSIESTERTWNMLAQSWQYAGHHEQALPAFEKATALAEDGNIDVRLAQSLARLSRWADCVATLETAFERGGLDAPEQAYLQLGHCHFYLKQWDEADRAFAEAEKSERYRATARQYRASVLSRRNTEAELADALREALEALADDDEEK